LQAKTIVLAAAMTLAPGFLYGQFDFHVAGRDVQVHSFASQGFAYSNQNNFLTMNTTDGSGFTDYGVNISTQLTDKLRVGGQMFGRDAGRIGNWYPTLDWASADYRFKDWFGIRGGKVKTTLGLYNDTQDMSFLHTWAILPQSTYPVDLRSDYIAHTGGDIYGNIPLKKAGSIAYTVYGGKRPFDQEGGMKYTFQEYSGGKITINNLKQNEIEGGDLRWSAPVNGLMMGASFARIHYEFDGNFYVKPYNLKTNADVETQKFNTTAFYAQYAAGKFHFDAEVRKAWAVRTGEISGPIHANMVVTADSRMGYVSGAYRINKLIEVGAYHSRYYTDWAKDISTPSGHMYDNVIAARLDLRRYLDLKLEGHFMDGYGDASASPRAFYPSDNPQGLKPKTNLFVMRLEYHM
jgi:hypothetical protein